MTFGPRTARPLSAWSFAEAASTAALIGLIVMVARLLILIGGGTIRSEPFFGSALWMAASRRRREFVHRMDALAAEEPLAGWNRRIREMDRALRPYAEQPVDIDRPGWFERLGEGPDPLDETGLRADVEGLVREIVDRYPALSDQQRKGVRELWRSYGAFAWVAAPGVPPSTPENLRRHLILFSIRDRGPDVRDEVVWLSDLLSRARETGIDFGPLLREVAAMSSDAGDDLGFGSTRAILLSHAR